jgi:hypothetical protein
MLENKLMATVTGELFHPTRIHYELYDKDRLQKLFSLQTFMRYDGTVDRWVWLYTGRAKKLTFKTPWKKIQKHLHPIVIGSFFQRATGVMFLEMRSIERTVEAISFFDRIIPRKVARVTDISIVNRLFDVTSDLQELSSPLDHLFANETKIDPEAKLADLKKRVAAGEAVQVAPSDIVPMIWKGDDQSIPEVERFPAHYYEDGIAQIQVTLQMRQRLALEHWKGNKALSLNDIIRLMTDSRVGGPT